MTAPNRVDELRKRYHENPRRFFAPLANEYRKTGFVDRAILLCEKHLGEQPGNMNGLVVYGQCLVESGRPDDAREPFEAALVVDPENLIALRHLGDIARIAGDHPTARGWYERVLELDRRNDEVIALLEEVGGGKGGEPPSGPSSARNIISVAPSVRVTRGAESVGMVDLGSPAAAETAAPTLRVPRPSSTQTPTPANTRPSLEEAKTLEVVLEPRPAPRASLLDVKFDFGETSPIELPVTQLSAAKVSKVAEAVPDSMPASAPIDDHQSTAELDELVSSFGEEQEEVEVEVPLVPPPADSAVEMLIDASPDPEPLSGTSIEGLELAEFSVDVQQLADLEPTEFVGGDVAPLMDLVTGEFDAAELAPPETTPPEAVVSPSEEDAEFTMMGLEELSSPQEDEVASDRPPATAPTFVTETMADLYLRQGHTDRAIEVYRQLIEQTPDDAGLRERLAALETPPVDDGLEFDMPSEQEAAMDEPAPAPANAMLSDISFDEVSLAAPSEPARRTDPRASLQATEEPDHGPTAREFFASFARRELTPISTRAVGGSPTAGGALMSPLDDLFDEAVSEDDEAAAHRLAAVGATSGPSGGTALDSLFGEGPSAPMPPELESESGPSSRSTVPRASEKLRFDQFFTPTESNEAATSVENVHESVDSADDPPSTEPDDEGEPPEDDDLDQFQGWLRRLTQ